MAPVTAQMASPAGGVGDRGGMGVDDLRRALQQGAQGISLPEDDEDARHASRFRNGLFVDADHINLADLGIDAPEKDAEQERNTAHMQEQLKQLELLHSEIAAKKLLLQQAQAALSNIHLSTDDE